MPMIHIKHPAIARSAPEPAAICVCRTSAFLDPVKGSSKDLLPHAGGLVYGFVGAGGNTGGAITQAIFFTPHNLAPYDSFKWLG